ncbi:MAG: DNA-3-methyladenine glycosylase family protein, partial [Kofleriaceae bacterium]
FSAAMGCSPSQLRRRPAVEPVPGAGAGGALTLRLDFREPYDWAQVISFLAMRAIPGVEAVQGDVYRRIAHQGSAVGAIEVRRAPDRAALLLAVQPSLIPVLMPLVARVRRLFDLDARPDVIARVLGRDPVLGPRVAAHPGLRVPGTIDGFEAAVRALLGQQVSVAAATTLAGRFAATFGAPYAGGDRLTHRFPTAREVAAASPDAIAKVGLPRSRAAALHSLARALEAGTVRLDAVPDLELFVAQITALPGIGPWTAHYLGMRALHLPDAFPAADLGVRKALAMAPPREVERRAEAWRPFRSYAVMHLWCSPPPGGSDVDDDDDRIAARHGAPVRRPRRAGRRVPARAARPRGRRAPHSRARPRRRAARRVLRG